MEAHAAQVHLEKRRQVSSEALRDRSRREGVPTGGGVYLQCEMETHRRQWEYKASLSLQDQIARRHPGCELPIRQADVIEGPSGHGIVSGKFCTEGIQSQMEGYRCIRLAWQVGAGWEIIDAFG